MTISREKHAQRRWWQADDEDTWNICMTMCQTGCQQSMEWEDDRDKGPWHERPCLAINSTSLRIQQQGPVASVGWGISGIISQIHSQEIKHTLQRQKARRGRQPAMLTLSLLPGDRLLARSSLCPFTSSLSIFSTLFLTSLLLLSFPPILSFLSMSSTQLSQTHTHSLPSSLPRPGRGKWKPVTVKCISLGTMCRGLFCKASQGDWRRGVGGAPLSLTSSAEWNELPQPYHSSTDGLDHWVCQYPSW